MWRLAVWCAVLCCVALSPALAGLVDLLPAPLAANLADLVSAAAATCEILPLELLFSRHYTAEMPHLEVVEYTRTSRRQFRALSAASRLSPGAARSLVVYVPGWWNTPGDESSQALVKALLRTHERVLVLDTRLSFCRGYVSSAARVKAMAHLLYAFIKKLTQNGFPLESLHLIGFSLGAHVAGITGRLVQRGMGQQLQRITALDPARPCFGRPSAYRLGRRDARFVQVVHSSAGALGVEEPLGHADVYVSPQAECRARAFTLECDHAQAWRMYASSVAGPHSFMGHRCTSWEELQSGECGGNATVLGYWCDERTRGLFLHRSSSDSAQETPERKSDLQNYNAFNLFSFLGRCTSWEELQSGECGGNATVLGYWCDERTRGLFLHRSPSDSAQETPERKSDLQNYNAFNLFSFLGR